MIKQALKILIGYKILLTRIYFQMHKYLKPALPIWLYLTFVLK